MDRKESLNNQIKLAKEGYALSTRYSKSNLPLHLRREGLEQKKLYHKKIIELLTELYSVKDE